MSFPDTNDGGPGADRKAISSPCPTVAGSADEIRVFFDLATENGGEWLAAASALLDGDEIARAERLRFDTDRRHFIAGRPLVRRALSRFIDVDPVDGRFLPTLDAEGGLRQGQRNWSVDPASRAFIPPVCETARLTIDPSLEDGGANWTFRLFQPGPRYVAALCVDVGWRPPVTVEMERLPVCREPSAHSCGP